MSVLRLMMKYAGYYVLFMVLISSFAASPTRGMLTALCGAALSVSMFAAIVQLLLDGSVGAVAQKVSSWCFRITVITTGIVVIAGIGIDNIVKVFAGN